MTCPRCGGSLYEDKDYAGRFLSCLTCGYIEPLDHYDPTGTPPPARVRKGGRPGVRPSKAFRGQTTAQRHPRA